MGKIMKIACISDTHGRHNKLQIPECDMLLCSGDVSGRGYEWEIEKFLSWFDALPIKHKVFIAGNHDFYMQQDSTAFRQMLSNYSSVIYLEDSSVTIDGLKIYGSPWQPWFYDWAFNFEPNDYLQAIDKWAEIPLDTNILLTHGPPYEILDRVANKGINASYNVGCMYLMDRIRELKNLKLHVFGHIHEAAGYQLINNVHYVNAASCTLQYQCTNPVQVIEI